MFLEDKSFRPLDHRANNLFAFESFAKSDHVVVLVIHILTRDEATAVFHEVVEGAFEAVKSILAKVLTVVVAVLHPIFFRFVVEVMATINI